MVKPEFRFDLADAQIGIIHRRRLLSSAGL